MVRSRSRFLLRVLPVLLTAACGGDPSAPALETTLGETTAVVLVNPVVNSANVVTLPAAGSTRSAVQVRWGDEDPVQTDDRGVAVLGGISAGGRSLWAAGGGGAGSVTVTIAERDLHEVALALTPAGVSLMTNLRYPFGGEVLEVTPGTPAAEVNAHLSRSNVVVLVHGGTYHGDLVFSGSAVTLFGAGVRGGEVTIDGDVTIHGSSNRIRGARILGDLVVTGSNTGVSFSRVTGSFTLAGSGAVLLNNAFCGAASLAGSNPTVLGNAGLAPIAASAGGC
jgi:hypothetical protein